MSKIYCYRCPNCGQVVGFDEKRSYQNPQDVGQLTCHCGALMDPAPDLKAEVLPASRIVHQPSAATIFFRGNHAETFQGI